MMAVREGEAAQFATLESDFVARINALDTTLYILQSKYKELENGLAVKLRSSEVGGNGQLDVPENDNSGGGVVFVHYDARQKAKRMKMLAERRKW
jgi:hypothetical protein